MQPCYHHHAYKTNFFGMMPGLYLYFTDYPKECLSFLHFFCAKSEPKQDACTWSLRVSHQSTPSSMSIFQHTINLRGKLALNFFSNFCSFCIPSAYYAH